MKSFMRHLILIVLLVIGLPVAVNCITVVVPQNEQINELPVINYFRAEPTNINIGAPVLLSWDVANANDVRIDPDVGRVDLVGSFSIAPSKSTTYTLTATNNSGSKQSKTEVFVSGQVIPTIPAGLPIINSFIANPMSVSLGDTATLSWNVSNATSLSINPEIGSVSPVGSITISPKETKIYTLSATNSVGSTNKSIQVTVLVSPSVTPLPEIVQFTASPDIVAPGQPFTLTWNVTNASSVVISSLELGQKIVSHAGSALVFPSVTSSYTLTATNSTGTVNKTINVTVSQQPSVQPVTMSWTGIWQTNWGVMHLTQSGTMVTGEYEYNSGKIDAHIVQTASGPVLVGTWSEAPSYAPPQDAGDIEWVMSMDHNSFTGKWRYGSSGDWDGSWNGTRSGP